MTSILEEFAYGNVSPQTQNFAKDPAYRQALECAASSETKLLERLEGREKELFQAYVDMQGEIHALTEVKSLIYGFKLGMMMTAETFVGMDDLYGSGDDCQ